MCVSVLVLFFFAPPGGGTVCILEAEVGLAISSMDSLLVAHLTTRRLGGIELIGYTCASQPIGMLFWLRDRFAGRSIRRAKAGET